MNTRQILLRTKSLSAIRNRKDVEETLDINFLNESNGEPIYDSIEWVDVNGKQIDFVKLSFPDRENIKTIEAEVVEPTQPKHDIINSFDSNHIAVLKSAILLDRPVLLIGHTGLGKTTLVQELANENNKNLVRISVHSGVTADEILGKWLAINGSTVWQDGILTTAMRKGDWVVFDEINACPADVMFALHSLLDDAKQVTLLEKDSEVVKPHQDFRFFATMNPPDDYAGTKEMNMAFMSRFNAVIHIKAFERTIENAILVSKGIDSKTADMLTGFATQLREKKDKEEIMFYCGTRDIINAGLLVVGGLNLDLAIQYAIFNKMNVDDFEQVKSIRPSAGYMTAEQKKIKELGEEIKKLNTQESVLKSTIIKTDEIIKNLNTEVQELKKNPMAGTQLTPEVQKALEVLKVFKKN